MLRFVVVPTLVGVSVFLAAPVIATPDDQLLALAKQQLEQAVRQNPSDQAARHLLARTYELTNNHEQAMEQYRLASAEGGVEVMLEKADVHYYRREFAEALDSYVAALAAAKKAGDLTRQIAAELGVAHAELDLGRYKKSIEICERLESSPPRPLTNQEKGRVYTIMGGSQGLQAKREGLMAMLTIGPRVRGTLEKAVEYDPEQARGVYALGRYFLEAPSVLGDKAKGEQLIARAVRLKKSDLAIRAWYIRALHERGKNPEKETEIAAFEKDFAGIPAAQAILQKLKDGQPPF
ncbi:MAG: tetratricopeptide repeat protein [Cyanobacteria bacterium NC_groundwater_1444_Ag_S-0.65um_54_12]|nr:tetratricopeptide repeat protein [Cyanobacteria bacterium NC_groundwater_1444_Ag_S-0.65um_54_12]